MRGTVCGLMALTAAALGSGCSSSTAPTPSGIVFVAGNHQTDTIQATLSQPLIVRIGLPPRSQSVAHQDIVFQSVDSLGLPVAIVAGSSGLETTTDSLGEARVEIAFGQYAGTARVAVNVPAFNYSDTARFTVLAGQTAAIVAAPADTAAYVGGNVAMHSFAVDRFGNRRSEAVAYSVISGPGTVSGSTVTVGAFGRIAVLGSASHIRDTSYVSGVPTGLIAGASDSGGIVMFNLDGTGYKKITSTSAGTVRWAPNGANLVFDGGPFGSASIQTVQLNGTLSTVITSMTNLDYPAYSRDGSYIYYVSTFSNAIRRVHPDGTGDSLVIQYTQTPEQFPNPSPDGTALIYTDPTLHISGEPLYVLTVSTGVSTALTNQGIAAYWSPTSSAIAYVDLYGAMNTVNADGTNTLTLDPGPYTAPFDWSPDGHWIIARNSRTNALAVINTSTKLVLPLAFIRTVGSPTWR